MDMERGGRGKTLIRNGQKGLGERSHRRFGEGLSVDLKSVRNRDGW